MVYAYIVVNIVRKSVRNESGVETMFRVWILLPGYGFVSCNVSRHEQQYDEPLE